MVDVNELVEEWFKTRVQNSAVSHQTTIYNLMFAAKEDLKLRLVEALSHFVEKE